MDNIRLVCDVIWKNCTLVMGHNRTIEAKSLSEEAVICLPRYYPA